MRNHLQPSFVESAESAQSGPVNTSSCTTPSCTQSGSTCISPFEQSSFKGTSEKHFAPQQDQPRSQSFQQAPSFLC